MKRKPTNGGTPVSKWFKSGTIYLLLLAAFLIILFRASTSVSARTQRVDLSTLANDVKAGKVTAIQVNQDGVNLRITRNDQSGEFSSNKEATSGITEVLTSFGVTPDQLDKVKIEVQTIDEKPSAEPPAAAGEGTPTHAGWQGITRVSPDGFAV